MDILHDIKILSIEILNNYEGKQKVVNQVAFSIVATKGDKSASLTHTTSIDTSDLSNFTSFETLEEETVKNWVINSYDPDELQNLYAEVDGLLVEPEVPNATFVNPPWIMPSTIAADEVI